jgi:hypothetical protein
MEAFNLRKIIQDKESLTQFITQMINERDRFLQDANNKIANMNGQIALLQELLKEFDKDGVD